MGNQAQRDPVKRGEAIAALPLYAAHPRRHPTIYSAGAYRYAVYRGLIDQQRVAVIWRETQGWNKAALVCAKKFVAEQQLTAGADEVYVNGDPFIREAKALEPVFKRRMFAETGV